MAQPIIMPKMGQSEEDCTLVKWHKREGDAVKKGDILFEIEMEKAVLEIESFYEGTILKIVAGEGATLPIGATVAFIGKPGEKAPDFVPPPPKSAAAPAARPAPAAAPVAAPASAPTLAAAPVAPAAPPPSAPAVPARQAVSPRARALAKSCAISLAPIRGTGPGGRVVEKDVRAYLADKKYDSLRISPAAKALAIKEGIDILVVRGTGGSGRIMTADIERSLRERPRPMNKMRQVIAQRLTQSVVTSPHFYLTAGVDMTELLAYRTELKAAGAPYTVTDFVLEAVIMTLQEMPEFNSSTDGRTIRWHGTINLGVATSLPEGLVVPVVRNAEELGMLELHDRVAALAARAREGKLAPDEMTGSTFTVSNMGMLNVEEFTAIINPGEAAILAISTTLPTPVVRDGQVVVRSIMKITLSSDHRLIDGAQAAKFVNAIRTKLEDVKLWKSMT